MDSRSILLVDDEVPLLKLMGEYLRHLGYHVEACTTGEDALRVLTENPDKFALAVVDLSLPDFPGDDLVRRFIESYPELPILICSGLPYSVEQMPPRVGFLQKPFVPKMLAQEIESLIGARE
jgi:CheY-like chemotaxis protein